MRKCVVCEQTVGTHNFEGEEDDPLCLECLADEAEGEGEALTYVSRQTGDEHVIVPHGERPTYCHSRGCAEVATTVSQTGDRI